MSGVHPGHAGGGGSLEESASLDGKVKVGGWGIRGCGDCVERVDDVDSA